MCCRGFGGFASAEDYRNNVIVLAEDVADSSYVADYYFTAGYDSHFMPINRHNEVMLSLKPANKVANKPVAKHSNKE